MRETEKERKKRKKFFLETGTARWQSALSTWHPTSLAILFKVRILRIVKIFYIVKCGE